jgi:hypothetical protein
MSILLPANENAQLIERKDPLNMNTTLKSDDVKGA